MISSVILWEDVALAIARALNIILASVVVAFTGSRFRRCLRSPDCGRPVPAIVWGFALGWGLLLLGMAIFILVTWASAFPSWLRAAFGQTFMWTAAGLLAVSWLQDRYLSTTDRWVRDHVVELHQRVAAESSDEAADQLVVVDPDREVL